MLWSADSGSEVVDVWELLERTLATFASWPPGLLVNIFTKMMVIMIASVKMFTIMFNCSKVTISLVGSGGPDLMVELGCDVAGRHMASGRLQVVLALCSLRSVSRQSHSFTFLHVGLFHAQVIKIS